MIGNLELVSERGGVSFKNSKRRVQYEVRHDLRMTYICDSFKGSDETTVYIFSGCLNPDSIRQYMGSGYRINQAQGVGLELLLQAVVPKTVGRALTMLSNRRKPKEAVLANVWRVANAKKA